ncbi:MAG: hypothetical protein KKC71_06125 [Chloroflexi bacterium]|nr:hypothetical protein [Chloroflexota bacterium]
MSFAVRAQPQAVEHTLAWSAFYGGVLYDAGHAAVADADGIPRLSALIRVLYRGMSVNQPRGIMTPWTQKQN